MERRLDAAEPLADGPSGFELTTSRIRQYFSLIWLNHGNTASEVSGGGCSSVQMSIVKVVCGREECAEIEREEEHMGRGRPAHTILSVPWRMPRARPQILSHVLPGLLHKKCFTYCIP